jgi:hypothetical protein
MEKCQYPPSDAKAKKEGRYSFRVSFKVLHGHCVKLRPGTNAALGEFDDALRDNLSERVCAIYKAKGLAGIHERGRHFLDNVRLKGFVS